MQPTSGVGVADSRSASCVLRMDETDDQPSVLGGTGPLGLGARQRALPNGDLAHVVRRLQVSRPSADADDAVRPHRTRTAGDSDRSASAARISANSANHARFVFACSTSSCSMVRSSSAVC